MFYETWIEGTIHSTMKDVNASQKQGFSQCIKWYFKHLLWANILCPLENIKPWGDCSYTYKNINHNDVKDFVN